MTYEAIVTKIQVRDHPNADRLKLGLAHGYQVVVSNDTTEGDMGVYFHSDGQLSEEMCEANDLIGYTNDKGERCGGFFPKNRRVKAQKFRGEKSEGYWTPLSALEFTGYDLGKLKEGDTFDILNGVPICNKYYTPATLRAMNNQKQKSRMNRLFAKHLETAQLKHEVDRIPDGSIGYITEKLHGTSLRFGYVIDEKQRDTFWSKYLWGKPKIYEEYSYLHGTRNTILADVDVEGYYGSEKFRWDSISSLYNNLHKGEIIYGEVVGYTTNLEVESDSYRLIMDRHDPGELKDIRKRYGDTIEYKYGQIPGNCKLFVYRITRVNEDGDVVELPWPAVKARCSELNLQHVPELGGPFIYNEEIHDLVAIGEELNQGESTLDHSHPREGVCFRFDYPDGTTKIFKSKSFVFGVMEGYIKSDEDYVDAEEIS